MNGFARHGATASLLATVLTVGACSRPAEPPLPERRIAVPHLPKSFPDAIAAAEERLERAKTPKAKARVHLALARLHASHANPAPIYDQVLEHAERAIELVPSIEDEPGIRDWLQLLRVLRRAKTAAIDLERLHGKAERELTELRSKISRLEDLEREMSLRRRQLR